MQVGHGIDPVVRKAVNENDLPGLMERVAEKGREVLKTCDADGVAALHIAAERGYSEMIYYILQTIGEDDYILACDQDTRSGLHWAAWYGNEEAVRVLLKAGSMVDLQTRTGFTPLHYACYSGRKAIVELLLKAGASMDLQDESNSLPLHIAKRFNREEIVQLLISEQESQEAKHLEERRKRMELVSGAPMDQPSINLQTAIVSDEKNKALEFSDAEMGRLEAVVNMARKAAEERLETKQTKLEHAQANRELIKSLGLMASGGILMVFGITIGMWLSSSGSRQTGSENRSGK